MKFLTYLKDKIIYFLFFFIFLLAITILLIAYNTHILLIIFIPIFSSFLMISIFLYDYFRKKEFYNNLDKIINNLDEKYLITELINEPSFYEGLLIYHYLVDIDKSMHENVNKFKYITQEFKEYIELWCHEIKTPIATSKLLIENNKNETTNSINEEINKIDNYVEQVLYYARSEEVYKDYIISITKLKTIIDNVIKRNKKMLIEKHIKIDIKDIDISINSDSKWLEFIINQVICNSIKYANKKKPKIEISTKKNKNNIELIILDNGIGIKSEELDYVFDKGFTGSNGRKKYNSTGIGLYLCKKLCNKLNHNIKIESSFDEYTKITIVFPNNSLIKEIK